MVRHRTKKVGITGKYGCRYGASIRKRIKPIEVSQHATYVCQFCGKWKVRHQSVGIWRCGNKKCRKIMAGGAWMVSTRTGKSIRATTKRLKEQKTLG